MKTLLIIAAIVMVAGDEDESADVKLCGPRPKVQAGTHVHCKPRQEASWVCRNNLPEGGDGRSWKWVATCADVGPK